MRDTIAIELFQVGSIPFAEKCNSKLSEGNMYENIKRYYLPRKRKSKILEAGSIWPKINKISSSMKAWGNDATGDQY